MIKPLVIVLTFILLPASLLAADRGLEVYPTDKELFETEPRRVITTVFRVTNKASEKREFTAELKLPEGWQQITKDFIFELDPNETDTRIVAFFVPQKALAGKYEVTYLVKGRKYPAVSDFYTIHVVVLPAIRIAVKKLRAPDYIIAGEDYQASFLIANESNITTDVNLTVKSGNDLPYRLEAGALKLAPGESKSLTITVKTDDTIRKLLRHHLQLTAHVLNDGGTKAQASHSVDIIPRVTGEESRYHTVPVEMTLRQVAQKNGNWKGGFQAEISGSGTLDEKGEKHVSFRFKGPDTLDQSRFGERDEYYLNYWTKDYGLHVGDRIYSMSSLTERCFYGRGIEGNVSIRNTRIGGYYAETRWLDPEEEQTAGYIDYLIDDNCSLGLNYLKKKLMIKMTTSSVSMEILN